MATQLTLRSVHQAYDDHTVLEDVTCSFTVDGRTGIIGENGSGKTTLLRLLAGTQLPDHGEVIARADGGIGYLAQSGQLRQDLTVGQVIDEALNELRTIEQRLRDLEEELAGGSTDALAAYGELLTAFELRGGYDADARTERALHGLGLRQLPRARTVGSLSGGEQVRLRLAALLAASPEVLLLDEPTNHLDDSALEWLERHLSDRRGTTIAVSHDRVFLERFASTLLEVDGDRRCVARYGNGYDGYLAERAAMRRRWVSDYAQWQANVAHEREAAATTARRVAPGRAMRDNNKMSYGRLGDRVQQSESSRVRNAEERLRRLLDHPVTPPPEPLRFTAALSSSGARGTLLDAEQVTVADRLAPVSCMVQPGDRLLVTGANGAGKSTLLQVLAGRLEPDSGHRTCRARVGYLPQEPATGRQDRTLLQEFAAGRPGTTEEHAAQLLALGLFTRDRLRVPTADLSTGQRQRLAVARLVTAPADVLLLDEPTNHLSLALVEDIEAALATFDGAVVMVSHDRRVRSQWRGTVWELDTQNSAKDRGEAACPERSAGAVEW